MKNTCPFYIVFDALKVSSIKICKKPPDLLFIVVFISFYISKQISISQTFRTLFNISYLKKKIFIKIFFSFFN